MSNTDKLREIVDKTFPLFGSRLDEWRKVERDKLLSDLTALISEGYVEKAKYDEAVRQRDELREALLGLSDPITVEDFEAAIKNTDG